MGSAGRARAPRRTRPTVHDQPLEPGMRGSEVELRLDAKLIKMGWWFDAVEADRVCYFFEHILTHSKGEWQGKKIELAEWQREKLRRLFGWRRPDGTRRYRRTLWWIPKKNGKSLLAAGIALYLLAHDNEPGAEVYSIAGNEDQARMVFDEAKKMVAASKDLSEYLQEFKSSIFHQASLSKYAVATSKAGTKHGPNVHGLIVDEVHAFADRKIYDVFSAATGSRRQPLEVVISTAGDNVGSFAYELWDYSIKLRDGVYSDPEAMVVVFCADPEDPWDDPRTWAKANPNLGVSPKLAFLEGKAALARLRPSEIPVFKQLYLNIWTNEAKAWLSLTAWRSLPRCPGKLDAYEGRACWGGLDLSKTTDLTALVLVFDRDDGLFDVLPIFWCPEEQVAERGKRDHVQYPLWVQQGFIRPTPGNIVDYRFIRADIRGIGDRVTLREIAYDRWSATELVQTLQDEDGLTMVEFGQGYGSMAAPSSELERRVVGKLIAHPDNPVLTWNVSNAVVRRDPAGNIKPDKDKSRERIDGLVALVMALGRATVGASSRSVYESRGIQSL